MIASKFRKRFDGPLPTRGAGSFPLRRQIDGEVIPTFPTVANAEFWWSWQYRAYSNLIGTLAGTGDQVQQWTCVPGWSSRTATAASAVLGPAKRSNGFQCDGSTSHLLIDDDVVFTDDFTVWFAYLVNNLATETLIPISRDGAGTYFDSFQVNNAVNGAYAMASSVYNQWVSNGTAALRITRFRRSGMMVYMDTHGVAENVGSLILMTNEDITLNALLARSPTAGDFPAFSNTNGRFLEIVGASANYDGASQANADVVAMIQSLNSGILGP